MATMLPKWHVRFIYKQERILSLVDVFQSGLDLFKHLQFLQNFLVFVFLLLQLVICCQCAQ